MRIVTSGFPVIICLYFWFLICVENSIIPPGKLVNVYMVTEETISDVLVLDPDATFVIDSNQLATLRSDDAMIKTIRKSKHNLGVLLSEEFFTTPPVSIREFNNSFKARTGMKLKFVLISGDKTNSQYFIEEFKKNSVAVINRYQEHANSQHLVPNGFLNQFNVIKYNLMDTDAIKTLKARLIHFRFSILKFEVIYLSISRDLPRDNDEIDPFSPEFDLALSLQTSIFNISQFDRIYAGLVEVNQGLRVGDAVIRPVVNRHTVPDQLFIQHCSKAEDSALIFRGLCNYDAIQCYISPISILASIEEIQKSTPLARRVILDRNELVLDLTGSLADEQYFGRIIGEFLDLTGSALVHIYVPPRFAKNLGFVSNLHPNLKLLTPRKVLNSPEQLAAFDFSGLVLIDFEGTPSILLRNLAMKLDHVQIEHLSLGSCLNDVVVPSAAAQSEYQRLMASLAQRYVRIPQNFLARNLDLTSNVMIVRRGENLLNDSFDSIQRFSDETLARKRFYIIFAGEDGIDVGGLSNEWFTLIMREFVNPHFCLFKSISTDQSTFHPNELSHVNFLHLQYFRLAGRLLAKGLIDRLPLQFKFTRAFQKMMLDKSLILLDLNEFNPELVRNLNWIAENEIAGVFDDMTFSVDHEEFGAHRKTDLKPNGSNIPVTDDNKFEYIRLVIYHRLYNSVKAQIDSFFLGLHSIIPKELLKNFSVQEWNKIISGSTPIDVDDWQRNTIYRGYTVESPQIEFFWRAVRSFTDAERRQLLKFAAGTSSVPPEGFSNLRSGDGISLFKIVTAADLTIVHLPRGHTCFCTLDLPKYGSYEVLRDKLLKAISDGGGGFIIA